MANLARETRPRRRDGHRVIDPERVRAAIVGIGDREALQVRARQFALLGDPTRLAILTGINPAGPISVSDLAAATGINDSTVSQTLRYLRASQTVSAERDGSIIRYQIADPVIRSLLQAI